MLLKPVCGTVLGGALTLLALICGPIAAAGAEVEGSRITSPGGPTYALFDEGLGASQPTFTVSGTTTGAGRVALRCYYGVGPSEYATVNGEVTPIEVTAGQGTFSVEVEAGLLYDGPCVLRAVPFGDNTAHPPGTASEEAGDPFHGPRVVGSRLYRSGKAGPGNYRLEASTLAGYFGIESAGDCGLDYSQLYTPETLLASRGVFECDGALYPEDEPAAGSPTRSELQIDGANAYGPAAAALLERGFEEETKAPVSLPGAPQVTVGDSFDAASGSAGIVESDPIVRCAPSTAFPPTRSSCREFVSTGVTLQREWQTSGGGHVAVLSDSWTSTNGAAHSLSALYDEGTVETGKEGGAYEFPGQGTFQPSTKGEMVTAPAGVGDIYYKEDTEAPSTGDGQHPLGAIVYDTPPSDPISVYRGSAEGEYNGFEMPYQGTIPAGGSYVLRMAFVQAYALAEVEALAAGVLAGYRNSAPALRIASPANGARVTTPSVTVTGTVADARAIESLQLNGHAVAIAPGGGAWSSTVSLRGGANTITVSATDQAGLSSEASIAVTYTPPTPKPKPSPASAHLVGAVRATDGEVSLTIACTGTQGTSCQVQAALSTVERIRGRGPIAVAAHRRRRSRVRFRRVLVGSARQTIAAGQRARVVIAIDASGRALLSRFGYLPLHLAVFLVTGQRRSTIVAENLVVRPHHRVRHQHPRHRRHPRRHSSSRHS